LLNIFSKVSLKKKVYQDIRPITEQPETLLKLSEKKAIIPSEEEIAENLPSRSAKLRYAIKKSDFYDFKTDILDQFKDLIEIESYGDKL
jgi:16S rRNA (cytosine1402-N4)-methyltransferase